MTNTNKTLSIADVNFSDNHAFVNAYLNENAYDKYLTNDELNSADLTESEIFVVTKQFPKTYLSFLNEMLDTDKIETVETFDELSDSEKSIVNEFLNEMKSDLISENRVLKSLDDDTFFFTEFELTK